MSPERPQPPTTVAPIAVVIGLTTFLRINGANLDDLRAVHGMARIRHAYTQVTPLVAPYFTTPTHDDIDAVTSVYGVGSEGLAGQFLYGLSTSNGMVGLIVAMVSGVLTTVLAMIAGVDSGPAIWIGLAGAVVVIAALFAYTGWAVVRAQARIDARFPTPATEADTAVGD